MPDLKGIRQGVQEVLHSQGKILASWGHSDLDLWLCPWIHPCCLGWYSDIQFKFLVSAFSTTTSNWMNYETLMTGPPVGAEMCGKWYENGSPARGEVLNLPSQHSDPERHIYKLTAETSVTLGKGERQCAHFHSSSKTPFTPFNWTSLYLKKHFLLLGLHYKT